MTTPPIPFGKSPRALVSGVEPLLILYAHIRYNTTRDTYAQF